MDTTTSLTNTELRDCIPSHRELAETNNTNAELRDVDYSSTKLPY